MTNYAIFGATSAIAEHTARALAAPQTRFFLVARDAAKLETLAADLRVRGAAQVTTAIYDFANIENMAALVDLATSKGVDQALIAFGALPDQERLKAKPEDIAASVTVNFTAAAILAQHIANYMTTKRSGLIAVITSVAGDRGRGSNYAYGAAKGGLGVFLAGLRHALAQDGVEVLDIRPGFVDTPMTRHFKKGLLWAQPDKVGADIAQAMRGRKGGRLYVPHFWAAIMFVIRNLPTPLLHKTKL